MNHMKAISWLDASHLFISLILLAYSILTIIAYFKGWLLLNLIQVWNIYFIFLHYRIHFNIWFYDLLFLLTDNRLLIRLYYLLLDLRFLNYIHILLFVSWVYLSNWWLHNHTLASDLIRKSTINKFLSVSIKHS
mgnify:FL=1